MNNLNTRKIIRDLSKKIFGQFIIAEFLYLAILYGGLLLGIILTSLFHWYRGDWLYGVLITIADNLIVVMLTLTVTGCLYIFYHYWKKTISTIESMLKACEVMMKPDDSLIILPPELELVEKQMNQMKMEFIRHGQVAKEAEQRKNDLVVYLAHDLKTPLTSVIGYLTLLRDEPQISNELQRKYIDISLNKSVRLEDLINEFFEITRFSLTTLTLECSQVNLSRMVEQIAYEFQALANEKDLKLELQIEPEMKVIMDVKKMERVLDNLFRNAINYSFEKESILIEVWRDDQNCHMRFTNHGSTIPPEKLARIFEQFYRLDSARSSHSGGAGLGLAIAKEIVELHKGKITVESQNQTIQFHVIIPAL